MSVKIKYLIILNVLFLVYSLMSILGKLAGLEGTVNLRFLSFYFGSLLVMAVYAVLWQQLIKHIPLMVAFCNKAIVILWGALWGVLFFDEMITAGKLTGIAMVICGVILFCVDGNNSNHQNSDSKNSTGIRK